MRKLLPLALWALASLIARSQKPGEFPEFGLALAPPKGVTLVEVPEHLGGLRDPNDVGAEIAVRCLGAVDLRRGRNGIVKDLNAANRARGPVSERFAEGPFGGRALWFQYPTESGTRAHALFLRGGLVFEWSEAWSGAAPPAWFAEARRKVRWSKPKTKDVHLPERSFPLAGVTMKLPDDALWLDEGKGSADRTPLEPQAFVPLFRAGMEDVQGESFTEISVAVFALGRKIGDLEAQTRQVASQAKARKPAPEMVEIAETSLGGRKASVLRFQVQHEGWREQYEIVHLDGKSGGIRWEERYPLASEAVAKPFFARARKSVRWN